MIYPADILSQVALELEYVLAEASKTLSQAARKEIKSEFSEYTQQVLDALSREELQSGPALDRFIESTLAQARMRMRQP